MKMKKFTALFISLVMILSIIPAINISAAKTTLMAEKLGADIIFSAPDIAEELYDAPVSDHWNGWTSVGNYANIRTYDGYQVLQFYSPDQTDLAAEVTAPQDIKDQTTGAQILILEWKHKGQPDGNNYYTFGLEDTQGVEIARFTIDKNVTTPGGNNGPNGTDGDICQLGFPANYTPMAIVAYNDPGATTHTVEYYSDGSLVYTEKKLAGTFDGFGSIQGYNGWWSNWSHIGFADLTISAIFNRETRHEVVVSYTIDGTEVDSVTKFYDTANGDTAAAFDAYCYSPLGSNTIYTANAAKFTESTAVELTLSANTGLPLNKTIGYGGKQYKTKSKNLIPNGDFSLGLAGWYNGKGEAASSANFKVVYDSETDTNSLVALSNTSSNDAGALFRSWKVEVGKTYFLTFTLDEASEYVRVAECNVPENANATNTIKDQNTSVSGKNNLIFTASDEYVRISAGWAQNVAFSDFALYEVEESATLITENIENYTEILDDITVTLGEQVVLPETTRAIGTLGTIVDAPIVWNAPDSYPVGERTEVKGVATIQFNSSSEAKEKNVKVYVTVLAHDHQVETFWHAGDDSNSPNFGLYNYLGNYYNGGVIVAEATFSTASGTNKLIMYGDGSTTSFGNAGALLRYFNTDNMFEYYDGSWQKSAVPCKYNTEYVLRTTIDIDNKTYTMEISEAGGDFVAVTPSPAAFRNGNLSAIDRMISTGSVNITKHTTTWISGFSYMTVSYVDEFGAEINPGYKVKAATGKPYTAVAPNLIQKGEDYYILEQVDTLPTKTVEEGEDSLAVSYTKVTMEEFESPHINHVRGDSAINMPGQVKMVFSDGQKLSYNVSWDLSAVDVNTVGTYTVTGTIDGIDTTATATVEVLELTLLPKTTENTVATNNGGWNWYVEPSGTHIQPGDTLATRYETEYVSNNGYTFKHDKTYMGWVEDEGTIIVSEYDHDTAEYKRVIVHEFLEADDHNNPAVVILPDGRIMIFYSKHTTEARMYYCVSKNPEDISEWNPWQYYECYTKPENATYPATYPTVFMVHDDAGIEGNEVIYVGWRGVHWKPTLAKFSMPDENGVCETIMGQTQFANTSYWSYDDGGRSDGNRRPYTKYDYDFERNKIYITFTANHPDNDVNNNIYYITFDIADQNFYTAKGNLLQPLPFENSADFISKGANGTNGQWGVITNLLVGTYPELLVFDANAQLINAGERRGWTWDIKVNEKGEPCIVYVDVTATPPGENGELPTGYHENRNDSHRSHHYYWYARWDSDTEEWVQTFLTYGGKWWHENATQERCYSGGLTFDHNAADANVIYLSIPTMGEHGNIFEIYRWESTDHGATWTIREPITENSTINNARPNAIYNYKQDADGNHQGPRLLWKSGEYRYWMNYEYKTGVWTDWAGEGFITQDDPEMFADAALYVDDVKLSALPTGETSLTAKFNVTNISIGDGNGFFALAHYNKDNILINTITQKDVTIPARSVPQIGMIGAPKNADGSLSPMGNPEAIVEIPYSANFEEGDRIVLLAWGAGIEKPMNSIISIPFSMSTDGNQYPLYETFTYEGTEKLVLDEAGENFNGWIGKAYAVNNAHFGTHSYAAITKAPFGNTGLHLYHVGGDETTGTGAIMASHSLPDTNGKDYTIHFTMRYIDEMSWNNVENTGFTLSHGTPVYNDGNATPCALQFRQSCGWGNLNGRNTTGYLRETRWFDGGGLTWIHNVNLPNYYDRGNAQDGLMTGSNYEVEIKVSPKNKTITFSIDDTYRKAEHTRSYVDAATFDWDSNPIDTITFSVGNEKWGELYVDDLYVEIAE